MRGVVALGVAAAAVAQQQLEPLKYIPLKLGSVLPQGWLYRELRLQADGLAGKMNLFWEPMNNTQWLGGTSTHEDWTEIFPYVLDGYVPQAILLQDPAQMSLAGLWMDYIIGNQSHSPDGWLGPDIPGNDYGMVYWPRWPVLLSFFQWYEATGNTTHIDASLTWLHSAAARLKSAPFGYDWTGVRAQDWVWLLQYLIDLAGQPASPVPSTEVPFLFSLMSSVQALGQQAQDWENKWWVDGYFPTDAVPGNMCNLTNHGVNQGMAVKSGATLYRQAPGGVPLGRESSYRRMQLLDAYHGVPTGVFFADEHLAGRMPSHGTETCTVVELMWSYNIIHETLGDALFADRAEKIAYNALPGSMTKDLWTRVYLQQMNEPISVSQQPHVWISDGPDSILYSLEGNYACCTSNFPQGWPKFIGKMVHTASTGGFAVSLLGPVTATLPDGTGLNVTGEYPFEDDVTLAVTGAAGATAPTPLSVRIPSWAAGATVSINGGSPIAVGDWAGSMYPVPLPPGTGPSYTVVLATNPDIRVDYWYDGAVAVHRGALVYSLQLEENFTTLRHYDFGSNDYAITQPANTPTPWNAALVLDPTRPDAFLTFQRVGPVPDVPFSSLVASNIIKAKARAVNAWGFASDGSAMPPPASPVDCSQGGACGQLVDVTLVPYGTTHLRMTEMPYTLQ